MYVVRCVYTTQGRYTVCDKILDIDGKLIPVLLVLFLFAYVQSIIIPDTSFYYLPSSCSGPIPPPPE